MIVLKDETILVNVAASLLKQVYTKIKGLSKCQFITLTGSNSQQVHSIATKYTDLNARQLLCFLKYQVSWDTYRCTFGDPVDPDVNVFLNLHAVPARIKVIHINPQGPKDNT